MGLIINSESENTNERYNRKIDELNEKNLKYKKKIEQLKAQTQSIKNRHSMKVRKERTRRLIQIGALTEKYFAVSNVDKVEKILQELVLKNDFMEVLESYKQ